MTWVYKHTETDPSGFWLWTVGFYEPDGTWIAASDHTDEDDAKAEVHYLNGGEVARLRAPSPGGELCAIRELYKAKNAAQARLNAAIRARVPVGSIAHVRHGDNLWPVVVVSHGDFDWGDSHRVTVEGLTSGKVYSVYASRLQEYDER